MRSGTVQASKNAAAAQRFAASVTGTQIGRARRSAERSRRVSPRVARVIFARIIAPIAPAFSASVAAPSGGLEPMGMPMTANVSHAAKQSAKAGALTSSARSATRRDRSGRVHGQTFPLSSGMIGSGPSISGSSGKWAREFAALST